MRQYTRYLKKIWFKVVPKRCEQTRNVLVILSHKLKRLQVRQAVFILVSSQGWMRTFPDHVRVLIILSFYLGSSLFFFHISTFVRLDLR